MYEAIRELAREMNMDEFMRLKIDTIKLISLLAHHSHNSRYYRTHAPNKWYLGLRAP